MSLDIKKLKNKKSINLRDYTGENLLELQTLEKLEKLNLDTSNLTSLDGIHNLKKLNTLKLVGCRKLKSIEGLEFLADSLTCLQITSGKLTDFSLIGKLVNLTSLTLSNVDEIKTLSFVENLKHLKELNIYHINKTDSLQYLDALKNLEIIYIAPWSITLKNNSFLPLTKQLVRVGKLNQIIEWEEVDKHLDKEGLKIYEAYFSGSKLDFIKRNFQFHCYDDYSDPYTKKNCDMVDSVISKLIKDLEKNKSQKMTHFKKAVMKLNQIDNAIEGFISTGERELLCDTLDEIAIAVDINIEQFEDGIATKWRTW